jgi:hypothetical protein
LLYSFEILAIILGGTSQLLMEVLVMTEPIVDWIDYDSIEKGAIDDRIQDTADVLHDVWGRLLSLEIGLRTLEDPPSVEELAIVTPARKALDRALKKLSDVAAEGMPEWNE